MFVLASVIQAMLIITADCVAVSAKTRLTLRRSLI